MSIERHDKLDEYDSRPQQELPSRLDPTNTRIDPRELDERCYKESVARSTDGPADPWTDAAEESARRYVEHYRDWRGVYGSNPEPVDHSARTQNEQCFDPAAVREFATGATRDALGDKLCYEGFLSPAVLRRYAQYMHKHRKQSDGSMRDPDNWQRGIPLSAYRDSLVRHVFDAWILWRYGMLEEGRDTQELEELLCAILFNTMGMLHEVLK